MDAISAPGELGAQDGDEAMRLRAQVGTCVHDLRNALAAQMSAIHLLTKSAPDPQQTLRLARGALDQCRKLKELADQLASLARTDTRVGSTQVNSARACGENYDADRSGAGERCKRILVVDDNVDAALTLAAVLRLEGYEVVTAHDGIDALHAIASAQPDVAVLDIEMPLMNGYETATRIRQEYSSLKLIAVSGRANLEDRERALAAGFNAHLAKPIDPERLMRLFC